MSNLSRVVAYRLPSSLAPGGSLERAPSLAVEALLMQGAALSFGLRLLLCEGLRAHSAGAPLSSVEVVASPRTSLNLPPALYDQLEAAARLGGVSMGSALASLVELGARRVCEVSA